MKRSVLAICLLILLTGIAAEASSRPSAGIDVALEPLLSDLETVVATIHWEASGDEASIAFKAPDGVSAVIEGGGFLASGDRQVLGSVGAGERVQVEIFGLKEGQQAFLAVDRVVGSETFQLVTTIGASDGRTVWIDAQAYRIFEKQAEALDRVDRVVESYEPSVVFHPTERTLVIESLQPKTAAVLSGEITADFDIPISAPDNCGPNNYAFSTVSHMNVSGAPAGSVTTDLAVHIEMSHWDASQMTIAYSEDDFYNDPANAGTRGRFLWLDEDSQVDLNQTWTRDYSNNELPGIGRDPNGWFQLWFVDCTGGAVGTVTYWSVEATYDVGNDIDLVADNVSVSPTTAAPGEDIEVNWNGHITGTGSIAGGFLIQFYISDDTNITTADTVLFTVLENTASDPGDTFGGGPGITTTLPAGLSDGDWYVGMIVDHLDEVDESNENNNTALDGITIDGGSSVDLVADSITPQAGSVAAGSSVNVNWFGHLDAGSSGDISGNFTVGFYLSNDATVTTGDTLLDRVTISGPTSPGESFGASGRSLSIPGGTAAGTRYLGLIVDDTGSVAETNENNNTATSAITVTGGGGGLADLVTTACSVSPTSVEAGDSITVNWTERNQGDVEAAAFLTRIYLSTNPVWEGPSTDPRLIQFDHGPYAAGFQQSLNTSVTIPVGTSDGTWYILVITDARDVVPESNEDNNMCASAITVGSGGGTGTSDRWLVPAAASAPGYSGSDWRTQLAITNPGNQTREATVYYVSDSASWPGTLLSGPISIGVRRSHYIDDVLRNLRPTAGLLYVVLDDPGPIVTSRTYNLAADGSTFGQGIPGIPLISGDAPDELILPMVHSGGGRYHTNLGLVHASSGSMTVEISIYTAGGSLLAVQQRTVTDGWDQINDVFDKMGVGVASIEGGWIKVRMISGSPDAWTCYASVVDKETGDPTYVAGVEAE